MAPHLKVASDFFILSNTPVETCPFCASEGDWIDSIVFVRMKSRGEAISPGRVNITVGRLEIGTETDADGLRQSCQARRRCRPACMTASVDPPAMLTADGISASFSDAAGEPIRALNTVSACFHAGSMVAVVGPSG